MKLMEIERKLDWNMQEMESGATVSFLNSFSHLINRHSSAFEKIDYRGIDGANFGGYAKVIL